MISQQTPNQRSFRFILLMILASTEPVLQATACALCSRFFQSSFAEVGKLGLHLLEGTLSLCRLPCRILANRDKYNCFFRDWPDQKPGSSESRHQTDQPLTHL